MRKILGESKLSINVGLTN